MQIVLLILAIIILSGLVVALLYTIYRTNRLEEKITNMNSNIVSEANGGMNTLIGSHIEQMALFNTTIKELLTTLPKNVLQTIQGSINPRKGKVGELISLMELTSNYIRLIPIGQPIDFIGIGENTVDFIEVKTDGGQLTKEEKHMRELIKDKKINFITIKKSIEIDDLSECINILEGENN